MSDTVTGGDNSNINVGNGNYTVDVGNNSTVTTGNGNDTVVGGNGDKVTVGNGSDKVTVGNNSTVITGNGNDTVTGGSGDKVTVGNGNNTVAVGANSSITAGNGNDTLTAGANSTITAGNGNITVTAGANSTVTAGNGNVTVSMGASDTVTVGKGNDTFIIQSNGTTPTLTAPGSLTVNEDGSIALPITAGVSGSGFGHDVIYGFSAPSDQIVFNSSQFSTAAAALAAATQVGQNTVITADANDTVTLENVKLSSLSTKDFSIATGGSGGGGGTVTVTISGIPSDATLSDSSGPLTITNGSITLTQAQLAGLTLKAGEVTSASLTVTATNTVTNTSVSQTVLLTVNPVAPSLTIANHTLSVNEDGSVSLGISETPFDAHDVVSLKITGVPSDATLSAGTKNNDGSWTLTPAQLSGLSIKAGQVTSANLTITATNTLGQTASTSQSIALTVNPVAPTLTLASQTLSVTEQGTVALGISETPFDAHDAVSLKITGVPSDASLSAGTKNNDGSWTLTPAQLNGLNLIAGEETTATLTVTATNTLGATASVSQGIALTVNPPTISVSVGGVAQDGLTLTATANVNVAGEPVNFQWQQSTDGSTWTDIVGATSSTYTAGEHDENDYLRVKATLADDHVAPAFSAPTTRVAENPNEQLVIGFGGLTAGLVVEGQTINVSASDPDDPPGFTYTFQTSPTSDLNTNTWTTVQTGTIDQYTPTEADENLFLRVITTFTDDVGNTETTTSLVSNNPVVPLSEAPIVTVPSVVNVGEGASAALSVSVTPFDTDDDVLGAVTISGVPSDVTLSAGTNNGDGSWTLTVAQLSGLTLNAGEDKTVQLTVTATATDVGALFGSATSAPQTITLNVLANEPPSLAGTATSVNVTEGGSVALSIVMTQQDADDSVSIMITGVPADASLSAGNKNNDGSWTLTPAQLAGLQIVAGEGTSATLTVTATNSEGNSAPTSQNISLTINPVSEGPVLGGATSLTVNEGGAVTLGATDAAGDGDDVLGTVTITGLPNDLTSFSGGTYSAATGTWTGTASQFNALSFKAGEQGTFNLTVAANTTGAEAGTTSESYVLTINPVAEAPTLTVGSSNGPAPSLTPLWSTVNYPVQPVAGQHLLGPANFFFNQVTGAFEYSTISNYDPVNDPAGPYSITQNVAVIDRYGLPTSVGSYPVVTTTVAAPARGFFNNVNIPTGVGNATAAEGLLLYQVGTGASHTLDLVSIANDTTTPVVGTPSVIANIGANTIYTDNLTSVANNTATSPTSMSSYAVAWDSYDGSSNFSINFEVFNASGVATSSIVTPISVSGVPNAQSLPAWRLQSAVIGGVDSYVLAYTKPDSTNASLTDVAFQRYSATGVPAAPGAVLAPDLSHYTPGATNAIYQATQPTVSPFPGGGAAGIQFALTPTENAVAWNETVTDQNGTHDQVEFVEYTPGTNAIVARKTFQFAGNDPQQLRVQQVGNAFYLVYGDATATHIIEYDANGNVITSLTDPTNVAFTQFENLPDGRIGLAYDEIVGPNETSQLVFKTFDLRTSGININDGFLNDHTDKQIAGTKFTDTFTGENNVNNTYYFVGSNSGTTPSDTFTGGSNGWNVAILPDARSNYAVATSGGTTTLGNLGDPKHSGILTANNVQAFVFAPTVDPSGNTGSLEATGDTLLVVNLPNGGEPISIDYGSTLELAATDSGTVTFSGPSGTFRIDPSANFTGQIAGLSAGDTIDLAGIAVRSATVSGSTLNVVETNNQTLSYQVSGALAGNVFTIAGDGQGGSNLTLSPIAYAWGDVKFPIQPTAGTHLQGPAVFQFNAVNGAFGYASLQNYDPVNDPAGPYTVTQNIAAIDRFGLLTGPGSYPVETSTVTLPAFGFIINANVPTGVGTGTAAEAIQLYETGNGGNHALDIVDIANPTTNPVVGTPTVVTNVGSDTIYDSNLSAVQNNSATSPFSLSSYAVSWDRYDGSSNFSINFQIFNANGVATSSIVTPVSVSGVPNFQSLPAWRLQNAVVNNADAYLFSYAKPDANHPGQTDVVVQRYNTSGQAVGNTVTLAPDLSHYAAGATDTITQEIQPSRSPFPSSGTAGIQLFQNGNETAVAWNETVTDQNGTHDQLEFTEFTSSTGAVVAHKTFQFAGGDAQQLRVSPFGNAFYLVYGDATATHVVEYDPNGNVIASLTDPTNATYLQFESFGDGRVGLAYNNVLDASQTSQLDFKIFDLRTSGLNINDSFLNDHTDKEIAGTRFTDTFIGENNVNNTYDYVGLNSPSGSGPSDTFTGGNNGWNVAILAGARSNYAVVTVNGVTTVTNVGDSQHAGSLTTTNVQALAFAPTRDPSNTGSLEATGDTLLLLSVPGTNEPISIDNGSTLELATTDIGTVTFSGPQGTLRLDQAQTFLGMIAGLAVGETIDLAGISVRSATINGSTLNIVETNNQQLNYQVSGALSGNYFRVESDGDNGTNLVLSADGYLWGTSSTSVVAGTHVYGPFASYNGGLGSDVFMSGVTTSGYTTVGPDQVTYDAQLRDAFMLPYASANQAVGSTTISKFPFGYTSIWAATAVNGQGRPSADKEINVYVLQDSNGNASIAQTLVTPTTLNGPLTVGSPTTIESGLSGSVEHLTASFVNTNGVMSSYDVAWDQFNASTGNFNIDFQVFSPSGTAATQVFQVFNQSGYGAITSTPAWSFRSAGTTPYGLVIAQHNGATNQDYVQFQGYNANGTTGGQPSFQIQANLSAYAPGATNQIINEAGDPNHVGRPSALQFVPNASTGTGYSVAWNETVTDSNGTHDQVEFAIYKPGTNQLVSQSTYQIADGNAQNIRLGSFNYLGVNYEVLAYGDTTGTHVVEYDVNGNVLGSVFDAASGSPFNQLEVYGDGRVGLIYDNIVDSSGTSQDVTHVYDFRTSGIPIGYTGQSSLTNQEFAGTQFNDQVVGLNNLNNTYYYVGSSTGAAPTDSFTGGTGGWNVAILAGARSNYNVVTSGAVTTLTNFGDPLHAGSLTTSNVQALAFAPTLDPAGNTGSLEATGDTLLVLGALTGGGEPISIDNGSTLELHAADSGTVTFSGPAGTFRLTQSSTFSGQIAGFGAQDKIDVADVAFNSNTTLSYSGGVLTVSDGVHTANLTMQGNYSASNFTMWSNGYGGTLITEPSATPTINVMEGTSVALSINATPFDSDDVTSVTISGVPSDAQLSAGVNNGNGSWTVTTAQLNGLTLTAGEAVSTSLQVTAQSSEGGSTASAPTQTMLLNVTSVAEPPSLVGTPISLTVNENAAVALPIKLSTVDGDDNASITISGVPTDARLSAGINNGNGTWNLTPAQLSGLALFAGEDGTATLTVTATSLEGGGSATFQNIALTINPTAEAPIVIVPAPMSATQGTPTPLNITVTPVDADDALGSITISGVPFDASLSAGTNNFNGTWTLNPTDLNGLMFTPGGEPVETLSVTASATEGSATATSAAQTIAFSVAPAPLQVTVTINGTAQEGQILTAQTSSSDSNAMFDYQWQSSSDGNTWNPIAAAPDNATYVVQEGDEGQQIRVLVSASDSTTNQTASATSDATSGVLDAAPTVTTPVIGGTAQEGQTLTASAHSGQPDNAVTYAWYSSADNDTTPIGNGATYAVQEGDEGFNIEVVATAINDDGATTSAASITGPVLDAAPTVTTPVIGGTAQEGQTLTASANSGQPDNAVTYAWYSSADNDANPIGTGATYVVQEGDEGNNIEVVATATNDDGATATAASAATGPVLDAAPTVTTPVISGTAREGQTLTASAVSGQSDNAVSYAWYSSADNYTNVIGAGSTYLVKEADENATIEVKATVTNDNGATTSAVSAATASVVDNSGISVSVSLISTSTVQEGQTLVASATITGDSDDSSATVTYQWQSSSDGGSTWTNVNGAVLGNFNGVASSAYQLTEADEGKVFRAQASFTDDTGQAVSATSAPTALVADVTPEITVPFSYAVDSLSIIKNGSQIYGDNFSQAPIGSPTILSNGSPSPIFYITQGSTWTESGGKAVASSTGVALNPNVTNSTSVFDVAVLNTNTNPQGTGTGQNNLGLKQNAAFTVTSSFDLVVPTTGSYGTELTDGTSTHGVDQLERLLVTQDSNGNTIAELIQANLVANTQTVLASQILTPAQLAANNQIEFQFTHAANTTAVTGAFALGNNGSFGALTSFAPAASIFTNGVTWTRADVGAFAKTGVGLNIGSGQSPIEGQTLTASATTNDSDATLHYQWQSSADGTTWNAIAGAVDSASYTVQESDENNHIRVVTSTTDSDNNTTASVTSVVTGAVISVPAPEGPVLGGATATTAATGGIVDIGATDTAFDADDTLGNVTITGLAGDLSNFNGGTYTTSPVSTVVNFDSVDTSGGAVGGTTLTNYLAGYGITFSSANGTPDILPYQPGNPFPVPVSSPNYFGVGGPNGTTYTLSFAAPVSSASFTVPGLGNSSTMALWSATAFAGSTQVSQVGDPNISFPGSSTQTYTLTGPGITSVQFFDNAESFAGNHLSFDNLTLNYANGGGTWTGTAAQFNALSFNAGADGTSDLSISAATTGAEAATTTSSYTLTVADPLVVPSGGSAEVSAPSATPVTFAGNTGLLQLDTPQSFTGTISGFAGSDQIDLGGLAFDANSTLGYATNAANNGGTLTVSNSTTSVNIALLGNYMASNFAIASDGHGGTFVNDPPPDQSAMLTQPHA